MEIFDMETRMINLKSLDEVMAIEESLEDDISMVVKSTLEEVKKCLKSGCSYGIFDGNKLVSYTLAYPDEYWYAIYIEKCVTLPEYRGNEFQFLTIMLAKSAAKSRGCRVAAATVAPRNKVSLENFKKSGFTIVGNRFLFNADRIVLECHL